MQIAALTLFLRAHRAWQEMGIPLEKRPHIERMHLAVAEPMPGEVDLFKAFVRNLSSIFPDLTEDQHAALGDMLHWVWARLENADVLGSLFQLGKNLEEAIETVQQKLRIPRRSHKSLPLSSLWDPISAKDRTFWERVDEFVLQALREFAESQENGQRALRRLFARDAARGWAFLETLRRRYWVVLMNPPFGDPVPSTKDYLKKHYPRTAHDLYAAFVERGLELLHPGGRLGAITSRTGFFLKSFQAWREEVLMGKGRLIALADLGYGVLDTAMVETAAYVVEKPWRRRL